MNVYETIETRLSIRRYADAPVPKEHMTALFRALQLAPSSNNAQNWEFIFVKDRELKRRLVPACMNQKFIQDCSYFIAGVADPNTRWHQVDVAIALTNLSLQATELGYGTCWIGAFEENEVGAILEVPPDKKVVICMTFGVPKGKHVPRSRKALGDFIHKERYGKPFA